MKFEQTTDYKQVSLEEGLNYVQLNPNYKLFSDGLEENEYIVFNASKGFCYEDGCVIGETFDQTVHILISLKWVLHHKFYIQTVK